jgi:hypothetical protein
VTFTTYLPIIVALVLGPWLASKATFGLGSVAFRFGQGLLILFAVGYLVTAMNDSQYARTYWPSTPWQHALGPDWPSNLLWNAARSLVLSGSWFLVAFGASLVWRRGKA